MAGENTSAPTKTQLSATFSTTNHTWTPSFESRPTQCLAETDRLSNGMALIQPPNGRLTLRRHT